MKGDSQHLHAGFPSLNPGKNQSVYVWVSCIIICIVVQESTIFEKGWELAHKVVAFHSGGKHGTNKTTISCYKNLLLQVTKRLGYILSPYTVLG